MNERIDELMIEAGFKNVVGVLDGKVELQKFAELIVRECAGRVDWILAEGGRTQGDLIREHFGVEP